VQRRFFDQFLRGEANGMLAVPRVRIEVRRSVDAYEVRGGSFVATHRGSDRAPLSRRGRKLAGESADRDGARHAIPPDGERHTVTALRHRRVDAGIPRERLPARRDGLRGPHPRR
jgi:hypothetical protein